MRGEKADLREKRSEVGGTGARSVRWCCLLFLLLFLWVFVPRNGIEDVSREVKGECFGRVVGTESKFLRQLPE